MYSSNFNNFRFKGNNTEAKRKHQKIYKNNSEHNHTVIQEIKMNLMAANLFLKEEVTNKNYKQISKK